TVVNERTCQIFIDHLVGEGRIQDAGVDVASQQIGHQTAATQRHTGKIDLVLGERPARQDVGAGTGRCDAYLLTGQLGDLGYLGVGLHHQVPAVVPVGAVGDAPDLDTLRQAGGHAGRGVQDQVGGTSG